MQLSGKVAVITGASRGIGKATAIGLAQQGCTVVICGKNKNNLLAAEKELKRAGAGVHSYVCDVSNIQYIKKFASAIKQKFNKIDILVNNAGVAYYKMLADNSEGEIDDTIDVNIRGIILMTKHVLPIINKNGIVINISSGAGKTGYPGLAVYCASKFAVLGFTESLAGELRGIKVVAVCPGGVDTDMYMSMSSRHPSLKPEHIASKIVEICTEPHKFQSGQAVEVYHVSDALNHLRMKYFGKG